MKKIKTAPPLRRINLVDEDGREEAILPGERTVTLYAEYEGREIVVMPDASGFRLNIATPGDAGLEHPILCFTVLDDGRLIVRWNKGGGSFQVEENSLDGITITPVEVSR